MSLNLVAMNGRLTRDPELRTTTTGKSVVEFSIAVDKRFKSSDPEAPTADFFRVTAWGHTAEFVNNYLVKGQLVSVHGRLESRNFEDKEGNKRMMVSIVADDVNGLERPKDRADASTSPERPSTPADPAEYDPFADE